MLFSREDVAASMNELFECAWQSVRDVPRAEIDFGGGRKLTRTLQGNVATYVCTSDGRVIDVIPGVWSADEYRLRLTHAAVLAHGVRGAANRATLVSDHHAAAARELASARPEDLRALMESETAVDPMRDMRKGAVEDPLKRTLRADTLYNETVRMPQVHALLAAEPLARPADLQARLFRDILGYDIEDPWLGLAPLVLGGEGGRHE